MAEIVKHYINWSDGLCGYNLMYLMPNQKGQEEENAVDQAYNNSVYFPAESEEHEED